MPVQNSVVIVNHNTKDSLLKLLANLAVGEAVNSEVIVVDSGSFDESADAASLRPRHLLGAFGLSVAGLLGLRLRPHSSR